MSEGDAAPAVRSPPKEDWVARRDGLEWIWIRVVPPPSEEEPTEDARALALGAADESAPEEDAILENGRLSLISV